MSSKKIEETSLQILKRLNIGTLPIPIRKVAQELGLRVLPYNLGEDVSGVLVIDDGMGAIGYNPTEALVRRRFTIAHELGHFCLHHNNKSDRLFIDKNFKVLFRDQRSATGEVRQEQEANAFAASILMPKQMLKQEIEKHDFDLTDEGAIKKLAKIFNVSSLAMTYRISNLDLF